MIEELSKEYEFKEIIPVSALKEDNIKDLINTIKKYLHEGDKYYSDDYYTDKSINLWYQNL